jgi:hypothetical protein
MLPYYGWAGQSTQDWCFRIAHQDRLHDARRRLRRLQDRLRTLNIGWAGAFQFAHKEVRAYGVSCLWMGESLAMILFSSCRLSAEPSRNIALFSGFNLLADYSENWNARKRKAFLPERSKGLDSSSSVFVLVGSTHRMQLYYTLFKFLIVISFISLWTLAHGVYIPSLPK